jgi:hypothetical protein
MKVRTVKVLAAKVLADEGDGGKGARPMKVGAAKALAR